MLCAHDIPGPTVHRRLLSYLHQHVLSVTRPDAPSPPPAGRDPSLDGSVAEDQRSTVHGFEDT
ncbi:hypothetical protein NY08_4514 [Rhodococcus sp. B7740]|nr:hypothetical protein NY08_4514 [Rhodococcus sp. B7740]